VKLVLLPGLDGSGELFKPFVEALGSEVPVGIVRYPSREPLTYLELERHVRESLPENEPYVVLGESFSGPIAISLAASRPRHFSGLILSCSFARNPRRWLAGFGRIVNRLPVERVPSAVTSLLLMNSLSHRTLQNRLDEALRQVSPAVLRTRVAGILNVDVTDRCADIRVPTLYLRAARDRVVPESAARLIVRALPGARIVALDAPHFLLQTAPNEAAKVVRQFLREAALHSGG
jgi:pimeloyl-ACP methyl ester carboxylesterase